MKQAFLCAALLFCSVVLSQNLFPKKLDNCITSKFCLDCGDQQANVHPEKFAKLVDNQNKTGTFKGLSGTVKFQILVDSLSTGCVLSHTDTSGHPASKQIVNALNSFDGWIPAVTEGKTEERVSFNMEFTITNGILSGKVERVDMEAFEMSFDHPRDPEIFNKDYDYTNKNLKNYTITVWNRNNSDILDHQNDNITFDNKGALWFTGDESLSRMEDEKFIKSEQDITDKGKYFGYFALASGNDGTVWTSTSKGIYSYKNGKWKNYAPADIFGVDGAYDIISNDRTGELFITSDQGLTILKDGKWSNFNKDIIKELPSNRVYFAKRDSKGNLWIGTFSGSIMIDAKGAVISFENSDTVLKGQCITALDEDEKGNIYFGVFKISGERGIINDNEGIVILSADRKWKQLTTENSGMPFNHTTDILYDESEKILWIATDRAGLVRYDLKNGWENYHSQNSLIPTSYISDIEQGPDGSIYLGTRQGLVKIERK